MIKVEPKEVKEFIIEEKSLFAERQKELYKLYKLLGQRYDCVVTNPPYISSSRMEGSLKEFVSNNYSITKSDLFATFILRSLELCNEDGLTGYMTPFVWMFISSYEQLREIIIDKHFINNLIQLEYSGFDGATVPICAFTLRNKKILDGKGSYIRLSDFKGSQNQAPKTLQAIQNPDCGWFYTTSQQNFKKIPGSPIGYWVSEKVLKTFNHKPINKLTSLRKGNSTSNNARFLRFGFEIKKENHSLREKSIKKSLSENKYWIPYNKGGGNKKWYGLQEFLVNWKNDAEEIRNIKTSVVTNEKYYMQSGLTWSTITSSSFSLRWFEDGFIFDNGGCCIFEEDYSKQLYYLGVMNGIVFKYILSKINPTLNFQSGEVGKFPIILVEKKAKIRKNVETCIETSKQEWNSRETSWDFMQNELLRIGGQDIEEAYDAYCLYWQKQFYQLHQNEEELNREFISIYGLQEELTPDVPLDEITLLKDEVDSNALKKIAATYHSGWQLVNGEWEINIENKTKPELPFSAKEVVQQFISYAVGCMFGRYSLDKPGLILANQGETVQDYLQKVALTQDAISYLPDNDNIIPMLDNEWFEDDIVARFKSFVKVCFGAENLSKNIAFIEEALGKDIRKYFIRDFYTDHIKRYKKRPIYWCFASPSRAFSVLIYMHRYTPDTLNQILNVYLKDYKEKLQTEIERQEHIKSVGTAREQTIAQQEQDKIRKAVVELQEYERELYSMATERISIDLDDGVLVNYNKFGNVIQTVTGLNDKATKNKVKKFDWIDTSQIR